MMRVRLSIGLVLLDSFWRSALSPMGEPSRRRPMDKRPTRGSMKSKRSSFVQKTASNAMTAIMKSGRACASKRRT